MKSELPSPLSETTKYGKTISYKLNSYTGHIGGTEDQVLLPWHEMRHPENF